MTRPYLEQSFSKMKKYINQAVLKDTDWELMDFGPTEFAKGYNLATQTFSLFAFVRNKRRGRLYAIKVAEIPIPSYLIKKGIVKTLARSFLQHMAVLTRILLRSIEYIERHPEVGEMVSVPQFYSEASAFIGVKEKAKKKKKKKKKGRRKKKKRKKVYPATPSGVSVNPFYLE